MHIDSKPKACEPIPFLWFDFFFRSSVISIESLGKVGFTYCEVLDSDVSKWRLESMWIEQIDASVAT